jgi:hydroxymethylpyrimidine/phosphomethylpyrimidine kinase
MKTYHRVLTIAGSDSGGGAGIQADLKTFSASGCYGMSVITAVTAQNTKTVTDIHPIPPECIAKQIDAVMEDIGTDAVKIGMLHSPEVIYTVTERLKYYQVNNIVVDPVMVAKSGDTLLRHDAVEALKTALIPIATLITPNIPEAAVLLQRSQTEMLPQEAIHCLEAICKELANLGAQAVLLKGGHLTSNQSPDILYSKEDEALCHFEAERIDTINTHGTGCTLSSAITANLAKGDSIRKAVLRAKEYITQALKAGASYRLGNGHGPVHHFYNIWK